MYQKCRIILLKQVEKKILLESASYGANGSRKSNVYEAFSCITKFVLNSCAYGKDHELYSKNLPKTFLFDKKSSDEIWFTEKNEQGESSLYSLVDFVDSDGKHIRKDADYEKNYLLGRYGAIPVVDPMNLPVR